MILLKEIMVDTNLVRRLNTKDLTRSIRDIGY